jgi:hypothetical protein
MPQISKMLAIAVFAFVLFTRSAYADTTWTLEDANFCFEFCADPSDTVNTAAGYFTVNSANDLVDFNVDVTGTNTIDNADYKASAEGVLVFYYPSGGIDFSFEIGAGPVTLLELIFFNPLPTSGGTVGIESGAAFSDAGGGGGESFVAYNAYLTGVSANAVPEPGSEVSVLLDIAGLVFLYRRSPWLSRARLL